MARIQALPGQLYELVCRRHSSTRQRGWWVRLVWICLGIEISRWICSTTVWGKNDFIFAPEGAAPCSRGPETCGDDTLGVARRVWHRR
jgi:hypothetical protein